MQCMLKNNGNLGPAASDAVKKCKSGEIYTYEIAGDECRIQVSKSVVSIPKKMFDACFTQIYWEVRGFNVNGDSAPLSCGPPETIPDAKQRKILRAHGYKLYIDGKPAKE